MIVKIASNVGELEFEAGKLVKINGIRPEYMDGYCLISTLREIANDSLQGLEREADLTDKLAKAEAAIDGMEQMLAGQRIELAQARRDLL